jgi:hypothetical protein
MIRSFRPARFSTPAALLPALASLVVAVSGCQTARAVTPPAIRPNARLEVVFRTPFDAVVTRPGAGTDTLRGVQRIAARYQGAAGDTVILGDLTYVDRRGVPRAAPRGAQLRYFRSPERVGRDGEIRELKFSPGRTLAAVTLPILVPVGLLVLLISL